MVDRGVGDSSSELEVRDRLLAALQSRIEQLETALADHIAFASKGTATRDLQAKVYEQSQSLREAGIELAAAERMLAGLRLRVQELEAALARTAQTNAAGGPTGAPAQQWRREIGEAIAGFEGKFGRPPAVLDWNSGLELAAAFPSATVFSPPAKTEARLPHLDRSVDVVVCLDAAAIVEEARRVASEMVAAVSRAPAHDGAQHQDAGSVSVRIEPVPSGGDSSGSRR